MSSLSQHTMMGVYPQVIIGPVLSLLSQSSAISIQKWTQDFVTQLQLTLHGSNGKLNGRDRVLLLPDPCIGLKSSLDTLGTTVTKHFKQMMLARNLATKHEIQWMEAKIKYTSADYRLAQMDGRLKQVSVRKPDLKPKKTSPKDTARKALARLGEQDKTQILRELFK